MTWLVNFSQEIVNYSLFLYAMNVVRSLARTSLTRPCSSRLATTTRAYSSFVPPASLPRGDQSFRGPRRPPKPRPESPTFYTARSEYYDQLIALESAIRYARSSLGNLQLLPLPQFARASLPPPEFSWKGKADMANYMQCTLTMARYRHVVGLLNQLNDYRRISHTAGCTELTDAMVGILDIFKKGGDLYGSTKKKPVKFDEHGRTYTVGRRKTSAARVWIIPAKSTPAEPSPEALLGLEGASATPMSVQPSQILVNNLPLSTYFSIPSDREKLTRPLKLAGVLGAYNIFALVRGGGTTGQSGAIAHGIAKGLAAHEPQMAEVLRRAKLLRRDPRMVERKKTGLAKARKRVRELFHSIYASAYYCPSFSIPGSNGSLYYDRRIRLLRFFQYPTHLLTRCVTLQSQNYGADGQSTNKPDNNKNMKCD